MHYAKKKKGFAIIFNIICVAKNIHFKKIIRISHDMIYYRSWVSRHVKFSIIFI